MAHTRQSRPDSGSGFKAKVLEALPVVPCSLGSGDQVGTVDRPFDVSLDPCAVPPRTRFCMEMESNQTISGNAVYFTACSLLAI